MLSLLLAGLGLSLVDCINPFTISAQVLLLTFVKKTYHVMYYVFGTYLTYVTGGLFVYWGIDKMLAEFWDGIMESHGALIYSLEILLGIGLVIYGILSLRKWLKKRNSSAADVRSADKAPSAPKSVKPLFLLFFGAVNTVGDLPTAIPYLVFIAKLIETKVPIGAVVLLILLYCLIYVLPLIIIYVLYVFCKQKMERVLDKAKKIMTAVSEWAVIVFPAALGIFIAVRGTVRLFA